MVQAPPGHGKTYIMTVIGLVLLQLRQVKAVKILVPNIGLKKQFVSILSNFAELSDQKDIKVYTAEEFFRTKVYHTK